MRWRIRLVRLRSLMDIFCYLSTTSIDFLLGQNCNDTAVADCCVQYSKETHAPSTWTELYCTVQYNAFHSREWCRTCSRVWVRRVHSAIDGVEIFPPIYASNLVVSTVKYLAVRQCEGCEASTRYYSDFIFVALRRGLWLRHTLPKGNDLHYAYCIRHHRLVEVHCATPTRLLLWGDGRVCLHLRHHNCFYDDL